MLILHLHSILFSKTKSIYAKKCTGQLKYWWNFYSCCLQMKIFRTGKFFPLRFCWIGMIKKRELRARISIFFSVILHPIFHSCPKRVLIGKKFLCKCVDTIVTRKPFFIEIEKKFSETYFTWRFTTKTTQCRYVFNT